MKLAIALKSFIVRKVAKSTATEPTPAIAPPQWGSAAERIKVTGQFEIDDIALLGSTHERYDFAASTPWDDFKDAFLALPSWFRFDLDPVSDEYSHQQRRLWRVLAGVGRDYDAAIDEKEADLGAVDAIRFPDPFLRKDPGFAANHILATGMVIKHSGLRAGQWALEYGAGFAQTALQFARLGVNVDTVDISEKFCSYVRTQADFYRVPLTPFLGRFGWNPRGDKKYDLIWFYESFHHCVDFRAVILRLKRDLAPSGTVILAGEPIPRRADRAVPYPWGLRLHSEVVAVIRVRHWFELGFTEDFLVGLFVNAGFFARRLECPMSTYGEGYIFSHRGEHIEMAKQWLPIAEDDTWHGPEGTGRWTRERSFLTLDTSESFSALEINATNHHPGRQSIELVYGDLVEKQDFESGERKTMHIDATIKAARLEIRSRTQVPARDYGRKHRATDGRALGIFLHQVRYA